MWFGDFASGAAHFDNNGNLLQTVGFNGTQQAQSDPSGNIWVSNFRYCQLDRFDSSGNYQFSTYVPQATGLVVVGVDAPAPLIDTQDFYSFTLEAGQSATIALTSLVGGNVDVTLLAGDGTPLALGVPGATNVDKVIGDFIATISGTYFVKVTGDSGAQYSLVVTRNADFDTEPNHSFDTAQPILATPVEGTQTVLGHLTSERLLELNASDSGHWYQDSYYTGYHDQYNTNYFVGGYPPYYQNRNFFVFSVPTIDGPVLGARLRLTNTYSGSYDSPTETYTLYDVSTSIADLTSTDYFRGDIFADLGTGTTYGSQDVPTVFSYDPSQITTIDLNADAIAASWPPRAASSAGWGDHVAPGLFLPVRVRLHRPRLWHPADRAGTAAVRLLPDHGPGRADCYGPTRAASGRPRRVRQWPRSGDPDLRPGSRIDRRGRQQRRRPERPGDLPRQRDRDLLHRGGLGQ